MFPKEIELWFDGSCNPNPGGWGCYGWQVRAGGEVLDEAKGVNPRPKPESTCNVSEWAALEQGLEAIRVMGWRAGRLLIFGDSNLVVNQLNGDWKCKTPSLRAARDRCLELLSAMKPEHWRAKWVPREQNQECDRLTEEAYAEASRS